ncbi:MAG: hypothetical protein JXA07_08970 [Spirochaetes bacterium]|nr:hypothetical protein [Spirochaetota bacterium]
MKRLYIFMIAALLALSASSCKNDRGTILNMPFVTNYSTAITSFSINGTVGSIEGDSITVILPCESTLHDLVAFYSTNEDNLVEVDGLEQINGETHNDFTDPVEYTVTTVNGRSRVYTVHVIIPHYRDKIISSFSINGAGGVIAGSDIAVTTPYGTDRSNLCATFAFVGHEVTVDGIVQESGVTINDFTAPKTYVVEACDGDMQGYTVTVTNALNHARDITAFSINGTPGTIVGTNIGLTLPYGTDPSDLIANFTTTGVSVTVDEVPQTSGSTANDFSDPVEYTVHAENGETRVYTVTVTVALNDACDLTAFSINGTPGTISDTDIGVTMPYGTDRTNLAATFAITGVSVSVDGENQNSGITTNDFTGPVEYTVHAQNGDTKVYTVTVTNALNYACDLTAFSIGGTPGTISGTDIGVTMPYGTDRSNLIASFTTTGVSVTVESVTQTSGSTPNDFTGPVEYTVHAENGDTKVYTVTVTNALNNACDITAFSIGGTSGTIVGTNIGVTMPYGTNRTSLVASFTTTGESVTVDSINQISGSTANDFTDPVEYTVHAENGDTKVYTVTVTNALNDACDITAFSINGTAGNISGTNIGLTLSYGTDPSNLIASFTTTGMSVTVDSVPQISGSTANDFTDPVEYTVHAENGDTKVYTVTVTISAGDACDITAFSIGGNTGTIVGTNIGVTMPYGTDRSSLIATFTTTGASVTVDSVTQISGSTPNDFNDPVEYTVHAENGDTRVYTVTVTNALNSARDITAFSIGGTSGSITGTDIGITMPYGTNSSNLIASFTTTGESVTVDGVPQISGSTANDFTDPVEYTVHAENGDTRVYTVTVSIALNDAREITAFSINGTAGVIGGTDITLTLPHGTNPASLIASFTTTGESVTVNSVTQISGSTANDFTGPVEYTVHAENGDTRVYTVTVSIALNDAREITAFSFNGIAGVISGTDISVTLPQGSDPSNLIAAFATTGVSVTVDSVTQISGSTANDFSDPVEYVVHAENSDTRTYTVTVSISSDVLLAGTYAAGYYHNGTSNIACLWNISVTAPVRRDLESSESTAVSVSVYGDDVYVAGTYGSGACYWKISGSDVTRTDLDGTDEIMVVDSIISGDYLYISGTSDLYGASEASYWKVDCTDGTHERITLTGGAGAMAYEMKEYGGIIYIAGTASHPSLGVPSPCYWAIDTGVDTQYFVHYGIGYGRAIMPDGSCIIIGGWFVYDTPSYTQAETWTYYGTPVPAVNLPPLMSLPDSSAVSSSLYMSGDHYFAGMQAGSACYWLNGSHYDLDGSELSYAYGLSPIGSVIYLPGYTNVSEAGTSGTACVWKKTGAVVTRTDLTTSATGEAAAWDVFVRD